MRFCAFWLVVCGVVLGAVLPASAQTQGLAYSEDVVFTVLEDSVRVDLEATMTNTTEERREGDTVFFSYFDSLIFVAPTGATDLSVTSGGASLPTTAEPLDDDFDVVTATLATRLRSGQTATFDVSYTLPKGEFRSDGAFFSNPAYHGFPLWSFSDPGTGSLTLRVPEDAELTELAETIEQGPTVDGYQIWTPTKFDVPEDFFTYVNVIRSDRFDERDFEVSGQDVLLRSWPGDVEWADFAQTSITEGIPALEDEIGAPIPEQDTLEVSTSATPFLFGYAGWYDPSETSIEIGNELDRGVLLHELSHAWFNQTLFTDRWMAEGLAEEFSWLIDRELGEVGAELPTTPRPTDAGAIPLNDWAHLATDLGNEQLRERELYGYNASWYVVRELREILGPEGMQELILNADANTPAYEHAPRSLLLNDWRRVLDMAASLTDAEGELALDQLWLDLVVTEEQAEVMATRRDVRDQYLRFRDRPLQWEVPRDIDQAMADWRFAEAEELIAEANRVLDLQRRVMDQAALAGLEAAEAGRDAYELDDPNYALAFAALSEQEEAISSVVDVRELVAQPLSTEEQWGFQGTRLDGFAEQAEAAYAANRFGDVVALRDQLVGVRSEAAEIGSSRLLWTRLGLGAALALVIFALVTLVRDRPWLPESTVS